MAYPIKVAGAGLGSNIRYKTKLSRVVVLWESRRLLVEAKEDWI
jgi:hypothetical protein